MIQKQFAIEVNNLVKEFRQKNRTIRAVDGVSFQVRRGEIFGLLGPNGAGKSTTIKILTTLIPPTGGTASVLGYDVVSNPLDVRKQICVVVQENAIELYLSVRNNFQTFGRFHGLTAKEIDQRSARVSELFGLKEFLDHKGIDLSGGLKRRVQVAKMFMVDKPMVFLDEATTGMDTFNKRATIDAIKEESRKGRTIVLTTHMLDEAEQLCDSLAIVNHGKVIAHGSIDKVKSMGLQLLYVNLEFKKVTKEILRNIHASRPMKVDVRDSSVEVTVRDEQHALKVLTSAKRNRTLQHFEINSASLEDVFVELVDKKERPAS
ncbi:MAG: ABC transporter ATP-binding protein [Ignavibacteriales bacterium]|nr:ABC transporter ATP-binding protein [Ignavibacteriales bacterium]